MNSLYKILNVLILSSLCKFCCANEIDIDSWLSIRLEHSFSSTATAEYTHRGNITVHGSITNVYNNPLTNNEKVKLQSLANEDKFYRLRAIEINNDGTEVVFLTSIKACMLAQSNLSDYITISLDYSGNVIGISLGVPYSLGCQGYHVSLDKLSKFNSKVYINTASVGPVPDTASYIQKLEREREAKERGDVKDNRSFLAKYWMYIVPVVIIMVISSNANPEGAAGGARAQ